MAKQLSILLLIILISCAPTTEPTTNEEPSTATEQVPTGPTTRNNTITEPQPVTVDEEQELPIDYTTSSGATLLVSDGTQAARFFIREGQSILLPLRTPTNITLQAVNEEQALIKVGAEETFIQLKEDKYFTNEVIVSVREILIR